MKKEYTYVSRNTLEYVYLHDCDCEHMYYAENYLIFEMEWMEILRGHPQNPFPQAHQSGAGRIELFQPKIVECTLAVKRSKNIRSVNDVRELDYYGLEFLEYEQEYRKSNDYYAELFMVFDRDSCYDNISLKIEYQGATVAWDTLNGVSWVERI